MLFEQVLFVHQRPLCVSLFPFCTYGNINKTQSFVIFTDS